MIKKQNTVLQVIAIHYSIQANPHCWDNPESIISLSEEWIKNANSKENKIIISLQNGELKQKNEDKALYKNDLDRIFYNLLASYNENIGVETEIFWYIIAMQNISVKRKNDRLRKILKKQYLTIFEDIATFLPNIEPLLQSEIFKIVYSPEEQQAIFNLIEKIKKDWSYFVEKVVHRGKFKDIAESNQFYNKILNYEWHQMFFQIADNQLIKYRNFYEKNSIK